MNLFFRKWLKMRSKESGQRSVVSEEKSGVRSHDPGERVVSGQWSVVSKILKTDNLKLITSLVLAALTCICSQALAVDGGVGHDMGAHNQKAAGIRGPVCASCHFTKAGKKENVKIWADLPQGAQTLPGAKGVQTICSSCHYPGNAVNARSGFTLGNHEPEGHDFIYGNVLMDTSLLGVGESHVMAERVETDPNRGKLPAALDENFFPLTTASGKDSGFTCTTCHDPHIQPNQDITGNGDYLRTKEEKTVGQSGQRTPLCLQCHEDSSKGRQHGGSSSCNQCHHPHDGYYQLSREAQLGRSILTRKVSPVNFQALPNVAAFGPSDGHESSPDVSSLCYSCHGPDAPQEMREAGATPIFGDGSKTKKAHHPMGSQAQLGKALRAPGLRRAVLNSSGQVTCTSCHNGFHRGKNLHFLRTDFTADSASLCTFCHSDKTAKDLGVAGAAHRQVCGKSPNQRGECMFCHFIHDGPDRGEHNRPATRALLRIEPVNLAWSDQANDTDTEDFEDLCFGCHSSSLYMKGTEKEGARLQPQKYFSHRFSSVPSDKVHPTLPVSDGDLSGKVPDDYGAGQGKIYCGSCHDVHKSANAPYLRGKDSPYRGSGFCARCHTDLPGNGQSSHPVAVCPRPGVTDEKFPRFAYGGKSGLPQGITSDESPEGQILCLTCHSMHAAKTSFNGRIDRAMAAGSHGKLLVADNFSSDEGSDLCRSCHTSYQGIIHSRHDFSGLNLGSPQSGGGVCSACHIPHGSREKSLLWARSLAEERKIFRQDKRPDYQRGVTLFCYDCHDDHSVADDDPPINSFLYPPQDIAFSDGPGKTSKVGFYETIPPGSVGEYGLKDLPITDFEAVETGGHYIKTAGLTEITNGISSGDKLSCNICHDPHNRGSGNEVFLRNPLGTSSTGQLRASRNTRNGTGTGRDICVSCHGYSEYNLPMNTPVRLFGIEIVKTPSQDKLKLAEHTSDEHQVPCTKCHLHNRMAVPQSPRTGPGTHEFHFRSLLTTGEDTIMLHQEALGTSPSDNKCDICHPAELSFRAGNLIFNDGQILADTTVCDVCHSRWGQFDGVNDPDSAKASWKEGVYENDELKKGKDNWCLGCHDDQPSRIQNPDLPEQLWIQAPNIAGTDNESGYLISGHGLPKGKNYRSTQRGVAGRGGAGLLCTACHSPEARHIVNSQREKKKNFKNWQANKFRLKQELELPRRSEEYRGSDFTLCFSCHKESKIVHSEPTIIGLPPGYWDYTDNHNPYVNLEVKNKNSDSGYTMTRFRNADEHGIYPLRKMGQGITIDFSRVFPLRRYNLHWNHLSLPDAAIDPNAIITARPQSQSSTSSNNRRTQTCYSSRCHAGTSVVKERPAAFWDSDKDGILDSRPSCTACHNPHGTHYISMTRDDLAIEHDIDDAGEEFGFIGSKEYGAYADSMDNYNDLYCWECHAKLQRFRGNYVYYPCSSKDLVAPESPK